MVKFWISLAVGIFCLLAWMGGSQEAGESTKWPSVPGVITDMSISESRTSDGSRVRHASVNYSYVVDAKPYQGDRIKVETSTSPEDAENYPKGKQVTVFYNPQKPQDSVLQQGGSGFAIWAFGGVGCLGFAGYTLLEIRKQKKALGPA